jgi:ERCC4-type nuclease
MPRVKPNPEFPVTLLVDTREQLPMVFAEITADEETPDGKWRTPYLFDAVPADVTLGGGVWRVRTERLTLPSGDYSLDGYASQVAVERKSIADLFGTVGQGRERFIRELERLDEMTFAAVVVEREWSDVFNDPPRHSRLSPKTVYRSVLAWQQRFPRVHWFFCPGRDFAEVTTFRILERFLKELSEKNFRKPRI